MSRLFDAEHPTYITMLRSPSSRDTRYIHILHLKVNLLLYTCLLGALEDGILLDPPNLCTYRLEPHDERAMEGVGHKRTNTPSAREAWNTTREIAIYGITISGAYFM